MKVNCIYLLICLCISLSINAQEINQDKVFPFSIIETPPVFPECQNITEDSIKDCFEEAVKSFTNRNLEYPEAAFDKKLGGRVLVNFKVNKNGEVFDIFPRGTDSSLETEAKRVVSLIPKLIPGKIDNKPVITSYSFPIDFVLLTTYGIYEVEVKAGSNIYSKPDSKSNILTYTQINNSFNARERGDFWEVELEFNETIFGYVSKDNILNINQVAVKNDDLNKSVIIKKEPLDELVKEEEIVQEELIIINKTEDDQSMNDILEEEKVENPYSDNLNNFNEKINSNEKNESIIEAQSQIATIISNNKKVVLNSDDTWEFLNPIIATIKSNGNKVELINDKYWRQTNPQKIQQQLVNNKKPVVNDEKPLNKLEEVITREEAYKRLRDLKSLFDDGILTKDEYEKASEKLKKIILQ